MQLTLASNYIDYWKFRGRELDTNAVKSVLAAQQKAEKAHKANMDKLKKETDPEKKKLLRKSLPNPNRYFKDEVSGVTDEMKKWRGDINLDDDDNSGQPEKLYAPSDSAGAYWTWKKMAKYADAEIDLKRRQVRTPRGQKIYYRSESFWKASASVNLPSAINHHYSTSLNGFIERCIPWAQALAVLSEIRFPDADEISMLEYPEGHEPRRDI